MKILLATDGSESARAAVDFFERFPFPKDTDITLLTVIDKEVFKEDGAKGLSDEQRQALQETEKAVMEEGEQILASEAARLRQAGWEESTQVRTGYPAEEIVHAAEELEIDCIILGSHGVTGGVKRFLLGSVSHHVLQYAHCSVLIVKEPDTAGSKQSQTLRMLLAYDGSAPSKKAVNFCAALPMHEGVELTALTVLPLVTLYRQDIRQRLGSIWQDKKKSAQAGLERVTKEVKWATLHVTAQLGESADVSREILDVATESNSDVIVLGHKGKGAIEKFLLGSVTNRIAHHAPCSVLAVRA